MLTTTPTLTTIRTQQYIHYKAQADGITELLPHVLDEQVRCNLELERMRWNARAATLWQAMSLDELEDASALYAAQWCAMCGHEFSEVEEQYPLVACRHVCLCVGCRDAELQEVA